MQQVLLCIAAGLIYLVVRSFTIGDVEQAFAHGQLLIDWERSLGIYWEPELQRAVFSWQLVVTLANWVYMGYWPLLLSVAVWLLLYHRSTFTLVRNAIFISGAIGMVIFATFPTAPPRMVDASFVDTVTVHSHTYRVLLPSSIVNEYAAMPSFHVGWTLLVGIALAQLASSRVIRIFGWLTTPAMSLATVLTANHYLLDVIAGGALALLGLLLATWLRDHSRSASTPRGRRPMEHIVGAR